MSSIYPTTTFLQKFGGISGRVTLNGQGVMGAHVTAFNPSTGALVGGFSANSQGQFGIGGLAPGTYIVRVEPLDDADVTSFFEEHDEGERRFPRGFYEKLVAVPAGGNDRRLRSRSWRSEARCAAGCGVADREFGPPY